MATALSARGQARKTRPSRSCTPLASPTPSFSPSTKTIGHFSAKYRPMSRSFTSHSSVVTFVLHSNYVLFPSCVTSTGKLKSMTYFYHSLFPSIYALAILPSQIILSRENILHAHNLFFRDEYTYVCITTFKYEYSYISHSLTNKILKFQQLNICGKNRDK